VSPPASSGRGLTLGRSGSDDGHGGPAALDVDHTAVDKAGLVTGQVHRGMGDGFRSATSSGGRAAHHDFGRVFVESVGTVVADDDTGGTHALRQARHGRHQAERTLDIVIHALQAQR